MTNAIKSAATNHFIANPRRQPLMIHSGEGAYVMDAEGRRYLDLVTGLGVNALGHAHPRIAKLIAEQASLSIHESGLYEHPYAEPLAAKLCEISGLDHAFFTNSGTEATELALKLIRCHGQAIEPTKTVVLALENAFHGRTRGALSVAGQLHLREPFQPFAQQTVFIPANDEAVLRSTFENSEFGIAAVLLEPIQGEGGVVPLTDSFMELARKLTTEQQALLVSDECQTGLGRTGRHFAFQYTDVQPDIVTVAKPLAGGLPLGAVLFSNAVSATFPASAHATTFGGGPLACRVALEFLQIMDSLLSHIPEVGEFFEKGLRDLALRHPVIKEVRGRGLMLATPLSIPADPIVAVARDRGLLINCTQSTVLRFLPPFILTIEQAEDALRILSKILP